MIDICEAYLRFGSNEVLRGANLAVRKGENLALIGASGTGKSVILKSALGLLALDRGEILIDGRRTVAGFANHACEKVGMLFQEAALFDSLPVWQNVAFRLLHGRPGLSRRQARGIALQKLERVGLSETVADSIPSELSGGMRKRVGLARAIASDPEILFFDEPTTGLDPIRSRLINNLIRSIVNESGVTAVMVTHDIDSVRAVADRVALLHQGRIAWTGPVSQLDSSDNAHVAQFVNGQADGPMTPDP